MKVNCPIISKKTRTTETMLDQFECGIPEKSNTVRLTQSDSYFKEYKTDTEDRENH